MKRRVPNNILIFQNNNSSTNNKKQSKKKRRHIPNEKQDEFETGKVWHRVFERKKHKQDREKQAATKEERRLRKTKELFDWKRKRENEKKKKKKKKKKEEEERQGFEEWSKMAGFWVGFSDIFYLFCFHLAGKGFIEGRFGHPYLNNLNSCQF